MNIQRDGSTSNAARLLWAGFLAILATGVGFGVRGGILANWGSAFGFTGSELGAITGAGLTGFCFGIIIGGLVCGPAGHSPGGGGPRWRDVVSGCGSLGGAP